MLSEIFSGQGEGYYLKFCDIDFYTNKLKKYHYSNYRQFM